MVILLVSASVSFLLVGGWLTYRRIERERCPKCRSRYTAPTYEGMMRCRQCKWAWQP